MDTQHVEPREGTGTGAGDGRAGRLGPRCPPLPRPPLPQGAGREGLSFRPPSLPNPIRTQQERRSQVLGLQVTVVGEVPLGWRGVVGGTRMREGRFGRPRTRSWSTAGDGKSSRVVEDPAARECLKRVSDDRQFWGVLVSPQVGPAWKQASGCTPWWRRPSFSRPGSQHTPRRWAALHPPAPTKDGAHCRSGLAQTASAPYLPM